MYLRRFSLVRALFFRHRHIALLSVHHDMPYMYNVNSWSEEHFIRNTSLFGPRLEYVFRNTCGIRPEYCEYGQNTAPWEVFWNTWNTYSHTVVGVI